MFDDIYNEKKILITGNTGFKGSWLTMWLLKLGARIYGISKDVPSVPSAFGALNLANKITHEEGDIRNLERVVKIVDRIQPDFVFHLAAQPLVYRSYEDPIETICTNVMGTANILESLRIINPSCCAVIITSDKCYDNVEWIWGYKESDSLGGKDIYSGSKGAAELIIKSYFHSFLKSPNSRVKIASARAGNVIGGGDWALNRIVPDCIRAWSRGEIVEIRSPHSTRPWQHVLEPLSGYLLLGQQLCERDELHGESFNFGPNTEYVHTVREVIEALSHYWVFDKSNGGYKVTGESQFHEAGLLKLNCDKALHMLKWRPTLEYNQMVDYTGTWYFNFYKGNNDMHEFTLHQIEEYSNSAIDREIEWTR